MRFKIIAAFLAVFALLVGTAAASEVKITAPSDVFLASNKESTFRFFVNNTGQTNSTVYVSLEEYENAWLWSSAQRGFESFLLEEENRVITINKLKPGRAAEVFVRLMPSGENRLEIICKYEAEIPPSGSPQPCECAPLTTPINIVSGDVPSFSAMGWLSVLLVFLFSAPVFFCFRKE
jgi:hypothetical protein